MRKACDEASSRIGKFIFGNESFQMECCPDWHCWFFFFFNLLIYGFFLKKPKHTIKGPKLFHFLGPREIPVRVNL